MDTKKIQQLSKRANDLKSFIKEINFKSLIRLEIKTKGNEQGVYFNDEHCLNRLRDAMIENAAKQIEDTEADIKKLANGGLL